MTKLKKARLWLGMTQSELAKKLRISQPTVAKLEKSGIGRTSTAKKYAKMLKLEAIDLLEI